MWDGVGRAVGGGIENVFAKDVHRTYVNRAPPAESFMWPDNGPGSTRACKSNEGNAIRDG